MKKVILFLLAVLASTSCLQAQIIETDSKMRTVIKEPEKPKAPRFSYFTVKLGGGMQSSDNLYSNDNQGAFNAALGYIRQINDHGLYAGGSIGVLYTNRMDTGNGTSEACLFRIGPAIGLMKPLAKNLDLDAHFGLSYAYWNETSDSYIVPEIGVGLWYKRIFAGIEYQGYNGAEVAAFLLNLGVRF